MFAQTCVRTESVGEARQEATMIIWTVAGATWFWTLSSGGVYLQLGLKKVLVWIKCQFYFLILYYGGANMTLVSTLGYLPF